MIKNNEILFRGKKAFTLLEVVVSITIFMIILIFLYKVLDDTKISNSKFEKYIVKSENINHLYKIIAEDLAESKGMIRVEYDKDKNSFLRFKTDNSFNNPFYSNVTYMISSNNNLIRIESSEKFEKEKSGIDFYNNSYIDILIKKVEKFSILQKDDRYIFIIKQEGKSEIMFPTFKMEN